MAKVLLVEDDAEFRQHISGLLSSLKYRVLEAASVNEGLDLLKEHEDVSIVLQGLHLLGDEGDQAIKQFTHAACSPLVVVVSSQGDPDSAAKVIENGAWDYIERPISIPTLRLVLQRALRHQQAQSSAISLNRLQQEGLIGVSPAFLSCLESLTKVASSKSNVLLSGETGTGKELFARAIHNCGPRAKKPFITVDCTSLPESLAESLLQGHTKGSFTGAHTSRAGLIKQADGGTLFLDEIGELPITVQKAFLRILQERRVRPLGSSTEESSDFRLITATNRDIKKMVSEGEFRQDLYYRLCTNLITLPPLRERKEDIKPLAQKFLFQACQEYGIEEKICSTDFMKALQQYDWPGNVRELINTIYASVDQAMYASSLYPQHLPVDIRAQALKSSMQKNRAPDADLAGEGNNGHLAFNSASDGSLPSLKEVRNQAMNQAEAHYLTRVIRASRGNVKEACRIADISRPRFYELLKKHNIDHHNPY